MKFRNAAIIGITYSLFALAALGCGTPDKPYEPKPAYSGGKKPNLPKVPTLPNKSKQNGDDWSVWGASHDLRSRVHEKRFEGKTISIVGWVVKTNYDQAPECAIHKIGKADPPDCKGPGGGAIPTPAFWIADEPDEKRAIIKVEGWANNFAYVYEQMQKGEDDEPIIDVFFQTPLPNPLPAVGGKVRVTGAYGVTGGKQSTGISSNPKWGILTHEKLEWIKKPPEPADFPQKPQNK